MPSWASTARNPTSGILRSRMDASSAITLGRKTSKSARCSLPHGSRRFDLHGGLEMHVCATFHYASMKWRPGAMCGLGTTSCG